MILQLKSIYRMFMYSCIFSFLFLCDHVCLFRFFHVNVCFIKSLYIVYTLVGLEIPGIAKGEAPVHRVDCPSPYCIVSCSVRLKITHTLLLFYLGTHKTAKKFQRAKYE